MNFTAKTFYEFLAKIGNWYMKLKEEFANLRIPLSLCIFHTLKARRTVPDGSSLLI